MYWTVGYECVECGSEGETQDNDSANFSAGVAIRTLQDDDQITTDSDGRPLCLECDGILTVWWSSVDDSYDDHY